MRRNANAEAAINELKRAGIAYRITRGKHIKVSFQHNGRRHLVVVAATPSDRHGPRKAASDARRLLRT